MFSSITIKIKQKKLILHAFRPYNFKKTSYNNSTPILVRYGRRTFFFSLRPKASLTIESSILIPLYILCLCAVIYIINILGLFTSIQIGMEESSRQINTKAYVTESFNISSISPLLLQQNFLSSEMKDTLDNSYIVNGSSGLNFLGSYLTSSNNGINFSIRYTVSIPFLPSKINIPMYQNLYFYPFIGEDISGNLGEHDEYVYVTTLGTVYHTDLYCSYLRSCFDLFPSSYLDNISEGNKSDYSPCHYCASINYHDNTNVFLCTESKIYHFDINCYHLNANAHKVLKSTIPETFPLCSRCQKGIGTK